jgi:hypothetical protein
MSNKEVYICNKIKYNNVKPTVSQFGDLVITVKIFYWVLADDNCIY